MSSIKRRQSVLALVAGVLVLLGLLAVFGIELADTQDKSKSDVKTRVHERGVLAAALIDSLFQTVGQQIPQDRHLYGARVVTQRTMDANRATNTYLALLDAGGRVIAHSTGFTAQTQAELPGSAALALIRSGHLYGLGDALPYGRSSVVDLAVAFPTRFGPRILVTGFSPNVLGAFITGELRKIPGVRGAQNYLIDGRHAVLASTNPAVGIGHMFDTPPETAALSRLSADVGGHYYAQIPISSSTWRIVLVAPDGPLFANVSGVRKWIPWIIFIAFGLVAFAALALGRRVVSAAAQVHEANARLATVNDQLAATNATLERRAAELARSNSELEQFASIASHDLQEPLRKVRAFTDRLLVSEADNLSDKGNDYLQRANGAAERMQRLIEDLLKFSRVATHGTPFAPVDLGDLTREVVVDLETQVEESGATVEIGDLPTVNADALQLRQLMQNLISNALKFRREGVTPEVLIDGGVTDGVAEVTVRDNGIGFDRQYSRRIFRVFERLHGHGEYPGTGIGLALCRKIAERHGGTIVADGVPGSGATFTVSLPIDQTEPVLSFDHQPDDGPRADEENFVAS